MPKGHHILERTKNLKDNRADDKENIYTDPKIIELIRSGIKQINRPHDLPNSQLKAKDIHTVMQPLNHPEKDAFNEY